LLDNGLRSLALGERRALLMDREVLQHLHGELWSRPHLGAAA
jgi:hypothetical protein